MEKTNVDPKSKVCNLQIENIEISANKIRGSYTDKKEHFKMFILYKRK